MKRILVPIATGTEEIELTAIQDTLVRFGAEVTIASVMDCCVDIVQPLLMSRGIRVLPDCHIRDCAAIKFDAIVLPGGMPGAEHLRDSSTLTTLLSEQISSNRLVGAICAAPAVVLGSLEGGIGLPIQSTGYPAQSFTKILNDNNVDKSSQDKGVVVSTCKNFVTGQGPGLALQFSLTVGELIFGVEKRNSVAAEMLVKI